MEINSTDYAKFWLEFAKVHGTDKARFLEQTFWDAVLKPFFNQKSELTGVGVLVHLCWMTGVGIYEVRNMWKEFNSFYNRTFNSFDYRPSWN